jgi:hypothetical protein
MERLASTEKNQDILRRENVRLKQELLSERSKSPPRYGRSPPLAHKEGLVPAALFQPSAPSTPMTPLTRLSTPSRRSPGHGHVRRACCTPLATAPEDGSIPFPAVPVGALVSDSRPRARAAHPLSRSPPRRPASVTAGRTKTSLALLPSPSSPALRPPGTAPVAGRRPNTSVVSSSANRLSDRATSAAGIVSCTLHYFFLFFFFFLRFRFEHQRMLMLCINRLLFFFLQVTCHCPPKVRPRCLCLIGLCTIRTSCMLPMKTAPITRPPSALNVTFREVRCLFFFFFFFFFFFCVSHISFVCNRFCICVVIDYFILFCVYLFVQAYLARPTGVLPMRAPT